MGRRISRVLTMALGMGFTLAACGGTPASTTSYPKTFTFGAILNLSGATAGQGKLFQQGVDLAVANWNADHKGIDGIPVEVQYVDGQASAAPSVTAAHKLIDVDKVPVLLNVYSSPVLAVAPIADQAKVLQLSAGANSPRLVNASKYFLSNIANAADEATVGLAFAKKALKVTKIALVYRNDDFGNGLKDFISKKWPGLGGSIVDTESHEPAQTDFSALAAKVKSTNPEAVYIASSAANQGLLVKQLREGGVTVPIVSYQGLEVPELFSVGGQASQAAYWTASSTTVAPEAFAAFTTKFQAKYGAAPTIFSANHYDLVTSMLQATTNLKKRGQPLTGTSIRDEMLHLGAYSGALGPVTFRADGTALRSLDIRTSQGGKAVPYLTAKQIQEQGIFTFGIK